MSENNEFPFSYDTTGTCDWYNHSTDRRVTVSGDHYYPSTIYTIDSKVEDIRILVKDLAGRISVIEQNVLRLVTQIDQVLKMVESNGKV